MRNLELAMPARDCRSLATAVLACASLTVLGCGEEGVPPTAPATEPAAAEAALVAAPAFRSISAGWAFSCGITTGDRAWCWGNNSTGQLGTFNRIKRLAAVPTKGDRPFQALESASHVTCALGTDRLAYCWGQFLPTVATTQPKLVDAGRRFVQVTADYEHMCGVTATGRAFCRGLNSSGQLGDGTATSRTELVRVVGGLTFRQVSTGEFHTCGVTVDDLAYCWGDNYNGMLGDGNGSSTDVIRELRPKAVAGGLRFRSISAGSTFTCAVATDDQGYCWGTNLYGQIGDETEIDRYIPTLVHGGRRWSRIEAGNSHVCGVTLTGEGFCWGRNAEGQLGTGALDQVTMGQAPRAVAGPFVWRQISAGGLHSCGVTTDDVAYCWGYNHKGEVGDGTQILRPAPTLVLAE